MGQHGRAWDAAGHGPRAAHLHQLTSHWSGQPGGHGVQSDGRGVQPGRHATWKAARLKSLGSWPQSVMRHGSSGLSSSSTAACSTCTHSISGGIRQSLNLGIRGGRLHPHAQQHQRDTASVAAAAGGAAAPAVHADAIHAERMPRASDWRRWPPAPADAYATSLRRVTVAERLALLAAAPPASRRRSQPPLGRR